MIAEGKMILLILAMEGAAVIIRHDSAPQYKYKTADEIVRSARISEKLEVIEREQDSIAAHVNKLRERVGSDSCKREFKTFKHILL